MKTTYRLFFLCFIAILVLPSCHNEDISTDSFLIERERIVPSTDSVSITGSYSFSGSVKAMKVNIGEQESLIDALAHDMLIVGSDFSVTIGNLKPSTKYYYRYSVDFGSNEPLLTDTKTFSTLETVAETPTVVIHQYPLFNEDSTFARIKCEVVDDGGASVTERGVFWNNLGDPVEGDSIVQHASGGLGIYTVNMEHLELGKTYFFRAYAKNEAGIGYSSDILVIKTNAPAGSSVDIQLSCNPPEGGSATGDGSYEAGSLCTVSASANPGYTFVNWTENNEQVSAEAAYTFAATTSRTLVANFTKQAFVITTEVDPEDSGTVTGAGGYNFGELCTLSATPKTGYDFWKWTKGGNTVSSEAVYSFTVDATATYVAHFKIKSYTVSVSADPSDGGTVTGGGSIDYGQSCTVHASPAEGFSFDRWTDEGDEVSSDADYTFTVTGNRSLVAHFTANAQQYTISVSANPINGGSAYVGSTPGTTQGSFNDGQYCTIHATANSGYTFTNWTENGTVVSTSASYTFTVTGNRTLVANFEILPQLYTITLMANPTNGGTLTGGGTYEQGTTCTVSATAKPGFSFVNWMEGSHVASTNASYSFTVESDRTLVAHFENIVTLPTVTTNSVTNITQTTATSGGNITNNGGASVTARGVCWSTSHNPTVNNSHTTNGSGTGTYTSNITGLSPNTTYYVRAYATNSAGTAYGDEKNFTTMDNIAGSTFIYNFDNSSLAGWSLIDADGDGYNWKLASSLLGVGYGHNSSTDCVISESYNNNMGPLSPDNYLVSEQVTFGSSSQLTFWACAQDASYPSEHFGVAVSTSGTNPNNFHMVQEWTMTGKSVKGEKGYSRGNRQGNWYQYTVDLSAYAGQTGYIAIRHFNCADQYVLDVDDIELSNSK